ncbi:MAG: class I SAM-dependent methyltransferase [Rhodospirillaceae bacterium]|jgi:2-polyprenyl-3-methyl-5-hydroxy-6-metoxy-1,4-benzoquinol methylase|nr:class I SAM-dependent methyltransferase [Rhodospirillaceae bacterium]MBT5459383.1 class I SAM-dependent methyltransferase [Rhodospirillaceae bacterium]
MTAAETALFSDKVLDCLKAPGGIDSDTLVLEGDGLRCTTSGERYDNIEGIPSLFAPLSGDGVEVTDRVKTFYEENPFPSYEGIEEFGELVNKGTQNQFSADLLEAIGFNKTILECGCGTGQLSHFLQLNNNHVLGIDMSLASLRLAIEHKMRNQLPRSAFAQMNIFNLAIKDASFDVVISHGVLHHTFDARRAFGEIIRKVKPGGIVMVGLYNRPARLPTLIRSKLISTFGPKIDYVVRSRIHDARKADIWIKDQYYNPHETWHSIDEVMGWFDENDVEFLNCSPPILDTDGETADSLFEKTSTGNAYQRMVTQMSWLGTIAREGALFDMIGRRRG